MPSLSITATTLKDQDIWAQIQFDVYFNNDYGSWNYSSRPGSITIASGPTIYESSRTVSFSHTISGSSKEWIGSAKFWIKKREKKKTWTDYVSASFSTDTSSGTVTGTGSFTVGAWTSYVISYNANGGTGAPANQTKWYSDPNVVADQYPLTLSSTTPTRTGYSFIKWNTKSNGSGTNYNPGGTYTANAAATLYAQWSLVTYTVTYNANGGSNAPSSQTKTYGTDLTLVGSPTAPSGQRFSGWATSATGAVEYLPGGKYSANANITLYAIYVSAYQEPQIITPKVFRCDSNGNELFSGDYITVSFTWKAGIAANGAVHATSVSVSGGGISYSQSFTSSTSQQNYSTIVSYSLGSSDTIVITVTDETDSISTVLMLTIPKGGAVLHINHTGKAVRFFGIAGENEEGVILQDLTLDVDSDDPLIVALTALGWSDLI